MKSLSSMIRAGFAALGLGLLSCTGIVAPFPRQEPVQETKWYDLWKKVTLETRLVVLTEDNKVWLTSGTEASVIFDGEKVMLNGKISNVMFSPSQEYVSYVSEKPPEKISPLTLIDTPRHLIVERMTSPATRQLVSSNARPVGWTADNHLIYMSCEKKNSSVSSYYTPSHYFEFSTHKFFPADNKDHRVVSEFYQLRDSLSFQEPNGRVMVHGNNLISVSSKTLYYFLIDSASSQETKASMNDAIDFELDGYIHYFSYDGKQFAVIARQYLSDNSKPLMTLNTCQKEMQNTPRKEFVLLTSREKIANLNYFSHSTVDIASDGRIVGNTIFPTDEGNREALYVAQKKDGKWVTSLVGVFPGEVRDPKWLPGTDWIIFRRDKNLYMAQSDGDPVIRLALNKQLDGKVKEFYGILPARKP